MRAKEWKQPPDLGAPTEISSDPSQQLQLGNLMSTTQYCGDIAIIGMSGAFPGARTLDEFHTSLCEGREMIRFLTSEGQGVNGNGNAVGVSHVPNFVPAVAAMDDIDLFDATFFGMTAQEAELTDPQHRLLLEHCWRALEHAGYDTIRFVAPVGVFVGATINTYLIRNIIGNQKVLDAVDPLQLNIANGSDFLATRISYKLNLKGPSHTVQSACSTSLLAVHCGCRSLLDMECDMALSGGVSVNLNFLRGYRYQDGGIMSPDGHCRVFDADARGTIFGSGVGVVLLKRLEDALAEGDSIHAVIKGSAINNDGGLKAGYTAPSVEGQAEVIAEAIANAGIDPDTISYIECHGTGTLLGDPVEVRALIKAFHSTIERRGFCALGSVKSNIGHLDAAAGIAGLIKVVLSLKHGVLPPSLHFQQPNPQIDFQNSPFYVNTKLTSWKNDQGPRRAGVSAFGVGGTNVHVVLEEAPLSQHQEEDREWQLILLSARTQTALQQAVQNLAFYLRNERTVSISDVAYTLQTGRRQLAFRWAGVCKSREQAISLLEKGPTPNIKPVKEDARPVAFLFPDESRQCAKMGAHLYESEPVFRQCMQQCAEVLKPQLKMDLCSALYHKASVCTANVNFFHLAFCAVEYSLAQLWISWGVEPAGMLGYGSGEYVAACLAGVMTLEQLFKLVTERARLIRPWPDNGIQAVTQRALLPFLEEIRKMQLKAPRIPYISSVTGTWIRDQEAQAPEYWVEQLLQDAQLSRGLKQLMESGDLMVLEMGPGSSLRDVAQEQGVAENVVASLPRMAAETSETALVLDAAGQLWNAGVCFNWLALQGSKRRKRVPLPTYPFERKRYWIEPAPPAEIAIENHPSSTLFIEHTQTEYSPRPELRNSYAAPQSEAECKAVAILEQVLGIHPIGVTDPYGELGGDSLSAIRVIDRLNLTFDSNLQVLDLYEQLSVRDLIQMIEREPMPTDDAGQDQRGTDRRRVYQQSRRSLHGNEPR